MSIELLAICSVYSQRGPTSWKHRFSGLHSLQNFGWKEGVTSR